MAELQINDPQKARDYFADKMTFTTGPIELERNLRDPGINIVDVRAEEDYRAGHIPGAISLPHDRWHTFEGLQRNKLNVLYCYSHVCHLAANAAVEFAGEGYPVMELDGGMKSWREHELAVEKSQEMAGVR